MRLSRRQFLKLGMRAGAALALAPIGCSWSRSKSSPSAGVWVNDIHSQLNPTRVQRVIRPASIGEIVDTLRFAAKNGEVVSVAGGRHAAGRQQFATDGVLMDMRGMNRVISLDADAGIVEAEAGILWPALMDDLASRQSGAAQPWGIVQKQGVDRMSLGGSLGANMHGNGLTLPPFVGQVESFTLVDANGQVRTCSRTENAELFSLGAGGYGMLGIVTSMRLRLMRRRKLRVTTRLLDAGDVVATLAQRKEEGCLYGDWHYSPDPAANDFLRRGVLATYQPLSEDVPVNEGSQPTSDDWVRLVTLAHVNRGAAFARYVESALGDNGTVVWSDTFQLDRVYADNYHAVVDRELGARVPASESLVEFFVPRPALAAFLEEVRADFLQYNVAMLYGTVRTAEPDTESVLAWARQPCAGIVFNFHVVHDDAGRRALADTYRRVVDIAARHGGTFYLTYHCFATRAQTELCHPRLPEFLRAKLRYDPAEVFQSDWYRHYRRMFEG
jgi:FAD/FMN-containing dehydrogenase